MVIRRQWAHAQVSHPQSLHAQHFVVLIYASALVTFFAHHHRPVGVPNSACIVAYKCIDVLVRQTGWSAERFLDRRLQHLVLCDLRPDGAYGLSHDTEIVGMGKVVEMDDRLIVRVRRA